MDTYMNESCIIGPVCISTIVHPSAQTFSLLRLLRCTLEYLPKLCELRYSEIWDNVVVRGLSGFFQSFPFWFPLLFFCPFLSLLLLTNQPPMISIKGGTGTVFVLSLISEDIHCTRQVFAFILGCYKLWLSTVPAGHYLLSALVFE